jgi:large subunit ribosomal protein L10
MAKALREKIVRELANRYASVDCCVFVNFDRISSPLMSQLRQEMRRKRVVMNVQKNSLLKIALKEAAKQCSEELFVSPTAAVYGTESPFELCRLVIDWGKKSGKLKIKGGLLQGKFLMPREITVLSAIPSREALLARLSGSIISPAARVASCLANVLSQIAGVLKGYSQEMEKSEKKESVSVEGGQV